MADEDERKVLYRAVRRVMGELRLSLAQIMEQAEGRPPNLAADYESNFRSGRIAKWRAQAIYRWLTRHHPVVAADLDAEIGRLYSNAFPLSLWEKLIADHGVFGHLSLNEIMIQRQQQVQVATEQPEPIQARTRLLQPFVVHLRKPQEGHALGFQCLGGRWLPLPLGAASLGVRLEGDRSPSFPFDPTGRQQPYFYEHSDAGLRRIVVVVMPEAMGGDFEEVFSRDRLAPPSLLDRLASELIALEPGTWSLYRINLAILAL